MKHICSLVALLAAGIPAANAATLERVPSAAGVANCQAALPAFEGQIRKRPLAIQNEGTVTAFVTCALPTEGTAYGGTKSVFVFLVNTGAAANVACTLVSGLTGIADYFPKTVSVPSNPFGNGLQVNWLPADNGGANFNRWTQLSCSLPPGVGIGHVGKYYDETVT